MALIEEGQPYLQFDESSSKVASTFGKQSITELVSR